MNEQTLQQIEARCDALPGHLPWIWSCQYDKYKFVLNQENEIMAHPATEEIGKFIATSRTDVPLLIAALREAWEKHDELVAACEQATIQIQYLHDKFKETGSGNQCLAQLRAARNK